MGVRLPGVGITLIAVALSAYCLCSFLRSSQECESTHSGRRTTPDYDAHKQSEAELDQKPLDFDQDTPPPSAKEEPREWAPTLTHADSSKAQHGPLSHDTSRNCEHVKTYDPTLTDKNGLLANAHDFIIYQPVMNNINEAKEKVLQWLAKFTMSGAEFDAGGHVPGCHPGTRIMILDTLQHRINRTTSRRVRRMLWLHGPAGVGKSAILQSLAERLSEASKLGATVFFSRPNGRHNPNFIIPTIAYQLAVRIPLYKDYVRGIIADDPKLLEKDMERQFKMLIGEPFTKFRLAGENCRWVILLDGLDECQGEDAQVLIVNLISRFTRQHPPTPLTWVIASRPEVHLQGVFGSEEVRGSFKEYNALANSDEACRDVERFLRAEFEEIRQTYKDLMPVGVPWPAEQDIAKLSETSSGLFAIAATIVHHVEDLDVCDPITQLNTVLSATKGLEPGTLSTLHVFYSTILASVPRIMSPIVKLVLTFYITVGEKSSQLTGKDTGIDDFPLVLCAMILQLQQHTVYGALRKLHSVVKVPSLNESGRLGIKFYHASFPDYLRTLGVYTIDVDMMTRMWWGCFSIVHGGDSAAYRDATAGGRPSIPLPWEVKVEDIVLEGLWRNGTQYLLHFLLPRCPTPTEGGDQHPHLSLDAKELPNVLEKIDFSALIFQRGGGRFI